MYARPAQSRLSLDDYLQRRLAQAAAGEITVIVDHADLLVLP